MAAGGSTRKRARPAVAARAGLAAVLVSLSTIMLAGCQKPTRPDHVVLISIDTMRADRLGLAGYHRPTTPNIDRWFDGDGRIYTRSYSTEASTTPSVVSMLTGQLPQEHRVRQLVQLVPKELKTLPALLPREWLSAGFVSNMMLTQEASGLGEHFEHYDDFVDERERYRGDTFERNAERTTQAVLDWMDKRAADAGARERPLFLWVHYMDPHGPYHPPDSWKRTFTHDEPLPVDIQRIPEYEREPGVNDGLAYVDAYDEEIAYMDSEVGRLLDGLDEHIDLDRTLVVFTADHGESMMEHEFWFRHAVQVYDEMVRVPLLVRGPGVEAARSDLLTSGIDIAPTILAALGLPPDPRMPAVDLRNGKGLDASRIVYSEASLSARDGAEQWRCAVQRTTKWVLGVRKGNCESARRLYDLAADPGELAVREWNATGDAPESLLRLCREDPDPAGVPVAWAFGKGLKGPKLPSMSEEDRLKSLKALGYAD
jgi:arylsulfatase A-like enzyme